MCAVCCSFWTNWKEEWNSLDFARKHKPICHHGRLAFGAPLKPGSWRHCQITHSIVLKKILTRQSQRLLYNCIYTASYGTLNGRGSCGKARPGMTPPFYLGIPGRFSRCPQDGVLSGTSSILAWSPFIASRWIPDTEGGVSSRALTCRKS